MFHNCITCNQSFEIPFDHKTYQIWLEINILEGKGKQTNYKYECPNCIGLDVLKCEYIVITKISAGFSKHDDIIVD